MNPADLLKSIQALQAEFGSAVQENVVLAHYSTAHVGGPASAVLSVFSAAELEKAVTLLWQHASPFLLVGSGSNVLFADAGYTGVILLNRARTIKIDARSEPPSLFAESGANLGMAARQAAVRGYSGLEWAATIPGTVGGAVYGNAGANGSDVAGTLLTADILHREQGRQRLSAQEMGYAYRSSALKENPGDRVVLSGCFRLIAADKEAVQARMDEFNSRRRRTQPPGASTGSMFRNPPGDYAGRLIEAAGLKGTRIGGAEISTVHANFFVNHGDATAADIASLLHLAREQVAAKFGVNLVLEVELLGDWQEGTQVNG